MSHRRRGTVSESGGCSAVTVRNRYFTGKFMTACDFKTDPAYFLDRHRLHNRLLHGWGVVCGLEVVAHPNPACRDRWVAVEPGIALDAAGREVVVEEQRAVEVVPGPDPGAAALPGPFVLCAVYGEEEVEPVPALYAEGTADPELRHANRIREVARFEVLPLAEATSEEWPCSAPGAAAAAAPPPRVPLALISRPAEGPGELAIDSRERRERPELDRPTRIEALSWPHGEAVGLDHLCDELEGDLSVTFSRPLAPAAGGSGLGPHTFIVEVGDVQAERAAVPGTVRLAAGGTRATFTIPPGRLEELAGRTLFITLKCDFLLDRRGGPVDGGHLGGQLPGGRGVPGGLFESWFEVGEADDDDGDDEDRK